MEYHNKFRIFNYDEIRWSLQTFLMVSIVSYSVELAKSICLSGLQIKRKKTSTVQLV